MRKIILLTPLLALFSLFTFNAFGADITCSAGEYLPKDKDYECAECLGGYYCEGGEFYKGQDKDQGLTQCPATAPYSNPGAKSKSDCYAKTTTIDCESGYYLPMGDEKCTICPSGSYCKGGKYPYSETSDQGIEKCPTTAPYSTSGASDEKACFDTPTCKNGDFLLLGTDICAACRPGYYCKGGKYPFSETGDQGIEKCPTTSPFSEEGSGDSSDCKANLVCLAGTYLIEGMPICSTCPAGYWCSGGTFTNNTSIQGITQCDTSTPFSPAGATSSTQCSATIDCGAGTFLLKGGIQCKECQEGYYCKGGKYSYSETSDQGLTQCTATAPYSNPGAKSESDCYAMTYNITCGAGEFLSKDNKCETCGANYYCKGGTWTPDDKEHGLDQCPTTAPYSNPGAKSESDCYAKTDTIDCNTGYYLPMGSDKCAFCPIGSYCIGIKGVTVDKTKDQGIDKCPSTAPYSNPGAKGEGDCYAEIYDITCSAGEYLPKDKDGACAECLEGYYCEGGGFNKGQGKDQGLTQCPATTPYSNPGAKSESDCYAKTTDITCPAGQYLPMGQLTCAPCTNGNYCLGGTFNSSAVANQGLTACDSATPFSPVGATSSTQCSATIDCAEGELLKAGSTQCDPCWEGYYCDGAKSPYSYDDKNDQGLTQCPTTAPYSDKGAKGEGDCYAKTADITCSAGYYLPIGSDKCTICPSGSYCSGIKGVTVDNTKDQGIENCPNSYPTSDAGADSQYLCYKAGSDTCANLNGNSAPDYGTFTYANQSATYRQYYNPYWTATKLLDDPTACRITNLSCTSPLTADIQAENPSAPLKNYHDDRDRQYSNPYVRYRAINDNSSYNSGTDDYHNAPHTGLQLGEWEHGWADGTKVHGIASCTDNYDSDGNAACHCGIDSYSIAGGSTVSFTDTKYQAWNGYDLNDCQADCAYECANYIILDNQELFGYTYYSCTVDCNAGEYLPAKSTTCTQCPAGSFCTGGSLSPSEDYAVGIDSCSDRTDGQYPNSDAGATNGNQCYSTSGTDTCANLNPVEHGTAEYANVSASYRNYYGMGQQITPSNACDITSLTCDSGYADTPAGPFANVAYYANGENLSMSNTKIRHLDGTDELGNASSLSNGEAEVAWNNGAKIHVIASCNTTDVMSEVLSAAAQAQIGNNGTELVAFMWAENGVGTRPGNTFSQGTTGASCWFKIDSYTPAGGSAQSVANQRWLFGGTADANEEEGLTATQVCARQCLIAPVELLTLSLKAELGELAQPRHCKYVPITCAAGTYLPANATDSAQCTTCTAGNYCPGGDFTQSTSVQGLNACPTEMPNSPAGSTNAGACYTSVTCPAGQYLPMGQLTCAPCTNGNYCLGGTFNSSAVANQGLTACDSATPFSPAGATSSTQCSATIDCAEGELLKAGSTQCDPCWEGYFCSGAKGLSFNDKEDQGLSECSKVDSNNPLSDLGAKSADDCYAAKCEAGEYLPEKSTKCESCPKAKSCNGGNFKYSAKGSQGFTYSCDAGYYLPADSEDCALCPSNYYCPGVTDVEFDENNAQGLYSCPTSSPYSLPGTASSGECSATMYIICPAGQYLTKNATSCIGCPANYYCPGGIYPYNASDDQGKIACNAKYPNSDAGSSFLQQCYLTSESYSCSKINPVSNGTATYANSSSGAITYSEYINAGQETEGIGACEITSLTCDTGYVKEPSSNGPLANYVRQAHSISKTGTLYRAASGNSGANSGAANGFGDSTGMTDGTAVIAWKDGTEVYLSASCNATAGGKTGEVSKSAPSGSGNYCWCQMTGYNLGNGSTSVSDANLVYIGSLSSCTDDCAEQCVSSFMSNTTVRTNIIGEYGEQMACVEPTYSCNPGYYLPANSTTCTLCEAGYYCPGFTGIPASTINNKIYGRESCPDDHPSSDAGTTDVASCYYDKTGLDCSTLVKILNTTSVSYANSPVTQRNYNGGASVVIPFGGCAVTGATCSNAGEVLVGTDGPLANYESPLYGMPSSTSNHNIYYRAIDGSSDTSSGANGNHGDSTGMTNGTFRLVYWNELDITGTASCAVNANGKYDCNCDLTSYKIGSGNTVSVNPAERLFSKTDFVDSLSSCEKKCANTCATQLAPIPEFGSLGMNKSCGVPAQTYTCAPGTYLPANATVCATCTQNHWCGGGTWEKVSFAQGLEDCPSEFPYSDAGSRDVAFCYKEPSTLQCSAVNPVRGANATYANSTAATKKYNDGGIQTDTIGACAISSLTCDTGYTATNNWSDGPLVNYINASRNLDLSATKLKSNDGSTKSGTGELFGGDATSLNKGTFELVYSNGTKIQGRSSCNSTSGDLFELKTNGTFDTLSVGKECWCNMTGYHLNGSSAVNVSDTNWVYWGAFGDTNSCTTTCTKRCIQVLFQPENTNGEYENALFGAYGKNSVPPCKPNSYSITWYDGNNNLETNQCYYDEYLTIPSSTTARTGYKIKWQIRTGN